MTHFSIALLHPITIGYRDLVFHIICRCRSYELVIQHSNSLLFIWPFNSAFLEVFLSYCILPLSDSLVVCLCNVSICNNMEEFMCCATLIAQSGGLKERRTREVCFGNQKFWAPEEGFRIMRNVVEI